MAIRERGSYKRYTVGRGVPVDSVEFPLVVRYVNVANTLYDTGASEKRMHQHWFRFYRKCGSWTATTFALYVATSAFDMSLD